MSEKHDPKLVAALRSIKTHLETLPEQLRGPFIVEGLAPYTPVRSAVMSEITVEQIQAIIDGCKGVTPGPWTEHTKGIHPHPYICGPAVKTESGIDKFVVAYITGVSLEANQPHIARLDPATVKALAELALQSLAAPQTAEPAGEVQMTTHLLSWLEQAYTHCKYGGQDWCEGYLLNARDLIVSQQAVLTKALADVDTANTNRDAARANFLTMQNATNKLRIRAEAAEARATAAESLLDNLQRACDDLAGTRSPETYLRMIDVDRATEALIALDTARVDARAFLNPQATSEGDPNER